MAGWWDSHKWWIDDMFDIVIETLIIWETFEFFLES